MARGRRNGGWGLAPDHPLAGGAAGNLPISAFDREELLRGAQVELEHTDDLRCAIKIAADHLAVDPHFYRRHSATELSRRAAWDALAMRVTAHQLKNFMTGLAGRDARTIALVLRRIAERRPDLRALINDLQASLPTSRRR